MSPEGDLRRQDDILLTRIEGKLNLLEQANQQGAKVAEARGERHDQAIATLAIKIDGVASLLNSVTAEPAASPMGRALEADIRELKAQQTETRRDVDEHDNFIQQLNGMGRFARIAFGASIFAFVASTLAIIASIATLSQVLADAAR